ncbi:hypothetical protein SAMN05877838_3781 [Hoeflea halophila]|uniref:Uncharacterized protein n=1 Tax=Hoeflea halophila TaxID=714899 RepID=A0A286IFN6_9HYPH|nr:hypothetical protein SAMN05877838_3781 [Hoeflea halophila]
MVDYYRRNKGEAAESKGYLFAEAYYKLNVTWSPPSSRR